AHAGSFDTFGLNVNLRTTSTTVSCPATGTVGVSLSCSAAIADTTPGMTSTPTGTVSFTPGGTCALLAGSCSVNITPSASGTLPVSANYGGDSTHATSSGGTSLTVNKRNITATVNCNPGSVQVVSP